MKILVTGGSGFIGSNYIRYHLKENKADSIINLDALTYAGDPDNLKEIKDHPNYKFVKGNICNPKRVFEIMKDVDIVVHFAAETHVDRSIADPGIFLKTNVLGTEILLKAALENKIKHFHHISTDEVFGALDLSQKRKFNEDTIYNPTSPYAASKAGAEHLVKAYYYTYGLAVTVTNCSNNYGPYALEDKKIPVYGDGLNVRDWLYVEDHCRAIDRILEGGKIGHTYCVGGLTADISNLEIIRNILKILKKDDSLITFVKDRPGHDRKYSIDWSKIKRELDWQPRYDLAVWLEKTVDWYRKNLTWWKKRKDKKFREYYQIQYQDL